MTDTITGAMPVRGVDQRRDDMTSRRSLPWRPRLTAGARLEGRYQDSGFGDGAWLIERDGQYVQVSELLYRIAEECDGSQPLDMVAAGVSERTAWIVTPDQVSYLLTTKLAPLGIVELGEEAASAGHAENHAQRRGGTSPFRLNARRRLLGPDAIARVSRPLRVLFAPPLLALVLAAVLASRVWLYGLHGATTSVSQVFHEPALFLVVVGAVLVAAVFHEFGHAAALAYGGGRARALGVGFYTVFPAFYTDVTDGYRLSRWRRVRIAVGGPYFHLVFSLPVFGAYLATREEFLLLIVVLIDAEAARQFLPFKRLDGYWLLADLSGLPDPVSLIKPLLRRVPGIGAALGGQPLPALRRSVRVVLVAYAVGLAVVVPLGLATVTYLIPGLTERACRSIRFQLSQLPLAISGHDIVGNRVLALVAVVVSLLLLAVQLAGLWMFVVLILLRPAVRLFRFAGAFPSPTRWRIRLGVAGVGGAAAMTYGAAWPWVSLSGPVRDPSASGLSTLGGKVVFGGGLLLLALTVAMLFARSARRRAVAGALALLVGLTAGGLAFRGLAQPSTLLKDQIAAGAAGRLGHDLTSQELARTVQALARLGVTASPSYGLAASLLGALLILFAAAGALALTAPRLRLGSTADLGPEPLGEASLAAATTPGP